MRITRFIDERGDTRLGISQDGKQAEILAGNLFGELKPSGEYATIAKQLAPLIPHNIFCIGLN